MSSSSTKPQEKCGESATANAHARSRCSTLRVATYNVLKPGISIIPSWVTESSERFPYIARELLPGLQADIVGLNEVTPEFEAALASVANGRTPHCEYIPDEAAQGKHPPSHYCALLCYLPVLESRSIILPRMRRRAVAALVRKGGELFIVCAVHLMAYEGNQAVRREQLQILAQKLRDEGSAEWRRCAERGNVCVMGDFNLHVPDETQTIYAAGMVDTWREVHGAEKEAEARGLSWEGRRCWWLPFDDRAMRLDRIALSRSGSARPISARLFGQECVRHSRPAMLNWLCPVYPSDHLGLVIDIGMEPDSQLKSVQTDAATWRTYPFSASRWESDHPLVPFQGRSIGQIVLLRILACAGLAAMGICAINAGRARL